VVVEGEEWAARDMVPAAQGPDLGWAAVEWVEAEAPEVQGAARALVVAARAAEVCGNRVAACPAEVELEDPAAPAEARVAAVGRGAVVGLALAAEVPGVVGEQVPAADRAAAEVGSGAAPAAALSPVVDQAADRVAVEGLAAGVVAEVPAAVGEQVPVPGLAVEEAGPEAAVAAGQVRAEAGVRAAVQEVEEPARLENG
jgi:hypothetical protein